MRRKDQRLLDAIEAKFGPLGGGDVLVLRGVHGIGDELAQELVRIARERGLAGSPWASEYVPLIVTLADDSASIEHLDEDEMRDAGWVRV